MKQVKPKKVTVKKVTVKATKATSQKMPKGWTVRDVDNSFIDDIENG